MKCRDRHPKWGVAKENRRVLIAAFQTLRKRGYVARANYLCCGGCAGYGIAQDLGEQSEEKRRKFQGCVFWHHQDEERILSDGGVYLRYGRVEANGVWYGKPSPEVGKEIVAVLAEHRLKTEWNGDPDQCIWVDLTQLIEGGA